MVLVGITSNIIYNCHLLFFLPFIGVVSILIVSKQHSVTRCDSLIDIMSTFCSVLQQQIKFFIYTLFRSIENVCAYSLQTYTSL